MSQRSVQNLTAVKTFTRLSDCAGNGCAKLTFLFTSRNKSFYNSRLNPFSHRLFCVSRLTAICHMRHPLKADLGKKMKTILVSVCASARRNKSCKIIQNRAVEANFYVFCYNFACRPSILILKRLAESSNHADSESIFFSSNFCFEKLQKLLNLLLGLCVCVCVRETAVLTRPLESRKKIWPFRNNFI